MLQRMFAPLTRSLAAVSTRSAHVGARWLGRGKFLARNLRQMWPVVSSWSPMGVSSDFAGSMRVLSVRASVPIWARASGPELVCRLDGETAAGCGDRLMGAMVKPRVPDRGWVPILGAVFSPVWNVVASDEKSGSEGCDGWRRHQHRWRYGNRSVSTVIFTGASGRKVLRFEYPEMGNLVASRDRRCRSEVSGSLSCRVQNRSWGRVSSVTDRRFCPGMGE